VSFLLLLLCQMFRYHILGQWFQNHTGSYQEGRPRTVRVLTKLLKRTLCIGVFRHGIGNGYTDITRFLLKRGSIHMNTKVQTSVLLREEFREPPQAVWSIGEFLSQAWGLISSKCSINVC
jgi:hypothetical protein